MNEAIEKREEGGIPFLCRVGWHKWTKWEHHADGRMTNTSTGGGCHTVTQKRRCVGCGFQQYELTHIF